MAEKSNPESFDAVRYVEKASEYRSETGKRIGAVAFVASGREINELKPEEADQVLTLIYKKHLDHAIIPVAYGEDEAGSILRAAYEVVFPRQEFFDFVVCASLVSFYQQGYSYVHTERVLHEVAPDLASSITIRNEFRVLKTKVDQDGSTSPWIQDCVKTFGKEVFSKWLAAQISGIEYTISYQHPHARPIVDGAVRPLKLTSVYDVLDAVPGYH